MMRGVVTTGTGTKLKNVPGGKVYGKTGTAEYGDENPPRTHSWFAGFQGDLAFSVLVEDGGFGAAAAAPAAADFLRGVDGE
jgi:cell division protein FtsI/penicillin-binding protein 2